MSILFLGFIASYFLIHICIVLCPFLNQSTAIKRNVKDERVAKSISKPRRPTKRKGLEKFATGQAHSPSQGRVDRTAIQGEGAFQPAAVTTVINHKDHASGPHPINGSRLIRPSRRSSNFQGRFEISSTIIYHVPFPR